MPHAALSPRPPSSAKSPDFCASDWGDPSPCSAGARSPLAHARSRSAEQRDRPVPPAVLARGPSGCSAASGAGTVGFLCAPRCGDRAPVVPPHFGNALGSQAPSVSTGEPWRDGGSGAPAREGAAGGSGTGRGGGPTVGGSRREVPVGSGRPRSVPAGVPAGAGGARGRPPRAVAAIRAGQSALTSSPGPRHRFLIWCAPSAGRRAHHHIRA